jgi:hypothetical protein
MTTKLNIKTLSKKEKNKLRLKIVIIFISFFIARAIFSDWDHFKAGLFGGF